MKLLLTLVLLLILPIGMYAQKTTSSPKKTDALYQEALTLSKERNSQKSAVRLHEILKLDSTFYMAFFALADLSHESGKEDEELGFLQRGLAISGSSYPAGFKFLAQILFKRAEYTAALNRIEHFATLQKSLHPDEQLLLESCRFSVFAVSHPVPFQPIDPGSSINTDAEEYWPSLNAESNELIFTRMLTKDDNGLKIKNPQEDFYVSHRDSGYWKKAVPLGPPVNTDENEGAQTLSADGRLLIFTGCGRTDGIGSCDLYISVYENGHWTVPVNMGEPVNSGAWESQPSLSADGKTLYFVSNRRGGKGNMDIWKAVKTSVSHEGIPLFGDVTNVAEINTFGNDHSPFIHPDGKTLYFATDGRPGLGGSDIFVTRLIGDTWSQPVNLGYPINTNRNEEGLVVEISGDKAWYTTDRKTGHGRDIFYFTLPDSLKPEPVSYLKGIVTDAITGLRISSDIVLSDLKANKTVTNITAAENQGEFLICLPSGKNYGLNVTRKGYLFYSENILVSLGHSKLSPKEVTIRLQLVAPGVFTTLKNIFFETNSWLLQKESTTQLDEMARFMLQNPEIVMEVTGHTDHVGSEAYNLELSSKRAETVVAELKKRNIPAWRLKSRGMGYSVPVGDNNTEEGRSANRRTEFKVLKSEK
ncbi:MAG TPA: OmpA family protein [Prolixibacteraceae bacterium]